MRRSVVFVAILAAAAANAACGDLLNNLINKTSATPTASTALSGTWATTQSLPGSSGSLDNSCVDFKWDVTEFSGTSGSGTFSATCLGNVHVTGSAMGNLTSSSSATWSATATGVAPGAPTCQIAISGTATIEASNKIRIPYSGTTCLGAVSGTEVIQK